MPSASPGPGGPTTSDFLTGITMTSPATPGPWATWITPSSLHALLEHWNGSRWTTVQAPDPGQHQRTDGAIGASSASSAWAVGDSRAQPVQSFALHCC